ncbi:MAG: beta-galactosidase [Propionibacteriaceae bacterium]|jgi:beta-galactosidase|nr:beta-galactosidase [Propionibacteriaceae bacterium]
MTSRFEIGDTDFLLDGQPFRILSGAIHYFRVHPDQWRERIQQAREMGLNTIETYLAWNAHAPTPDVFHTEGALDLGQFLDCVAAEGMYAIVRPGPYICAEWTGGGLPAWLFRDGIQVRSSDPAYLAAVRGYYQAIGPILAPRQLDRGGPLILMQVENEYGAYGSDANYLRALVEFIREAGITVPLTTVDQPNDTMLANGGLPELHRTGSFGSNSRQRLATLRRHQPTGPLLCMEYWNGWFDYWGQQHHTTSAATAAADLDELLASGASVNLYLFHGGTNFGFDNGAGDKGCYASITTSYDYDAPLDEAGNPTDKYWAFREVLAKYTPLPAVPNRGAPPVSPRFEVRLERQLPLWDALDLLGSPDDFDHLPTNEEIGQRDGFTLYRTIATGATVVEFAEVRDRAIAFLDRSPIAVLARDHGERRLAVPRAGSLELLVENLGRVGYGPRIGEATGLIGPATVTGAEIGHWQAMGLDLGRLEGLEDAAQLAADMLIGPVFAFGSFDTPNSDVAHFLDTSGWTKGVVWINGFNIGRYWSRGPQRTLYVPAPLLLPTGNRIAILELHTAPAAAVFVAGHNLGAEDF